MHNSKENKNRMPMKFFTVKPHRHDEIQNTPEKGFKTGLVPATLISHQENAIEFVAALRLNDF